MYVRVDLLGSYRVQYSWELITAITRTNSSSMQFVNVSFSFGFTELAFLKVSARRV